MMALALPSRSVDTVKACELDDVAGARALARAWVLTRLISRVAACPALTVTVSSTVL
jgi:hypothetical protein